MKQVFIKSFCIGSLALLSVPSVFAQDNDKTKDKTDKKETQQIIITRKNNTDEKTVIEIKGDKVTINGKDANDAKDVTVRMNKIRDIQNLSKVRAARPSINGNFNFDTNLSLFSEDENRAMLGVVTDASDDGAEIVSVSKESAAEKAGLKKGDIIKKIDNKKIEDADDVSEAVRAHKPGDKINITIDREGKQQKLTAELGKYKGVRMNAMTMPERVIAPEVWRSMPNGESMMNGFNNNAFVFGPSPRLGLSVQDTDDGKGVKVLEADDDGNAAKAGIKKNDVITHVNDKEVKSTDEISKAVRESREKGAVRLQVLRDGKTQNIEVKIPRKLKTTDL